MSERGKELFGASIDLPPADRAAFLAAACGDDPALQRELLALLRAHEQSGDFLAHPAGWVDAVVADAADDDVAAGEAIGDYELIEPLGRGGAGVVWRARQLRPVVREVALKLLRRGRDGDESAARFRAEWQLLARMQHPNVAKVLDAGVLADGRPWLAMELVEGAPVTEHATAAGLPLRERLVLFIEICRAVHHAHQKGVVHRDLKPANVLVTMRDGGPRPVVIDFGIAIADELGAGARGGDNGRFGTPEYMSPEQAGAEALAIDVRTDVYALGVLLYELACGERPHRRPAGPDAARHLLQAIRTQDPPPPSRRTAQRLPRDLDRVVACAMAKDPAGRYPSAVALADDVVRVLASVPIAAAPTPVARRAALFVRRHRLGSLAAAAVALAVGVGLVGAFVGHREARRAEAAARVDQQRAEAAAAAAQAERDRATREAQKANRALDALDELWSSLDVARVSRPDYSVREMLQDFERAVAQRVVDEPEVELRLHRSLAWLRAATGESERAAAHATRAVDLARATGAVASEVQALVLRAGARLEHDFAAAAADAEAALALATAEHGVGPAMRAMALELRAQCFARADRHGDALTAAEAALRLREEVGEPRGIASALRHLASARCGRGDAGDVELAVAHLQRVGELLAPFGDIEHDAAAALVALASLRQRQGDQDGAEASFREGLRRQRLLVGETNWLVASTQADLGWLLHARGRDDEAEPLLREALAHLQRDLGDGSPRVSEAMQRLGAVVTARGDLAEAERLLAAAFARFETLPGHPAEGMVGSLDRLAYVRWRRGDRATARANQQEAVDRAQRLLPPAHEVVSVAMTNLAGMLAVLGELSAAEALLRDALARAEPAGRTGEAAVQRQRLEQLAARRAKAEKAAGASSR